MVNHSQHNGSTALTPWATPQELSGLVEALLTQSRQAILLLDVSERASPKATVVYVNAAYTALLGCTADAVVGSQPCFWRALTPAQRRTLRTEVQPVELEYTELHLAGHPIPLRVTLTAIPGDVGPQRCVAILEDMTALREIMTSARCLIWQAAVEGDPASGLRWDFHVLNEEAVARWLPLAFLPGQTFADAWSASRFSEDLACNNRTCAQALQDDCPRFAQEFRVRLADGSIRWLAEDVQIETLGPGRWRLVGVCTDVTERKNVEDEMREVMTSARCLVWHGTIRDTAWNLRISNEDAAQRLLGIPVAPGQSLMDALTAARVPEDDARCSAHSMTALRTGQQSYSQDYRIRMPDGQLRWLWEDVQIAPQGPGHWRLIGVCTDITERKRAEEEAQAVMTSARCLLWHALQAEGPEGLTWEMQIVNEEAVGHWLALARRPGERLADAWPASVDPEDQKRMDAIAERARQIGASGYCQEFRVRLADGSVRWLAEDVQIETLGPGRWRLVGVCTDITERKEAEQERERLLAEAIERADQDPLTGLLNHRAFHARLQTEADRAGRENTSLGIAVLDLDNFKFFNDAYGHRTGDLVLRTVADALRQCCRSYDIPCRFGGDEFTMLMPGVGLGEAPLLAARLSASLQNLAYCPPESDTPIPLHLSLGLAIFPDEAPTRLEALELADARLRRVKSGGAEGERVERLRAQLTADVEGFSMLSALVTAVDNKDRYTRRHSEDVMTYSLQIARELGWDEAAQQTLASAALLHDVGKIGVPDAILRKPAVLTPEEQEIVRQHPVTGAALVSTAPPLAETLPAVRHHHERWDGGGYPDGLAGPAIPHSARLLAVADAFSAMTTDRPYRQGMSPETALTVLHDGAGTQWDPECVRAFLCAYNAHQ